MSDDIEWIIPASVLRWLDEAPRDRPVVILLRHSVRPPLDPGDAGYMLPLTSDGVRLATDLGRRLGARLRTLHASPLLRCVQTAEALRGGAGVDLTITPDRLLGDPGVFVHDNRLAWPNWQSMGHEGVMSRLVSDDSALTGMASPTPAARFLVHHMLARAGDRAGVHVFVTHDSLVTAAAARLLGEALGRDAWPMYLEGAFFWREGDALHTAYRDTHRACLTGPLCGLNERDVIELARRGAVDRHDPAAPVGQVRGREGCKGVADNSLLPRHTRGLLAEVIARVRLGDQAHPAQDQRDLVARARHEGVHEGPPGVPTAPHGALGERPRHEVGVEGAQRRRQAVRELDRARRAPHGASLDAREGAPTSRHQRAPRLVSARIPGAGREIHPSSITPPLPESFATTRFASGCDRS